MFYLVLSRIALLKIVENKKLFISILTVFNVIVFLILFISFGYWFFTRNKKTEDDDNTGVYFENKLSSLQVKLLSFYHYKSILFEKINLNKIKTFKGIFDNMSYKYLDKTIINV